MYERIAFKSRGKYKLRDCFRGRLRKIEKVVDLISGDLNGTWWVSNTMVPIRDTYTAYEDRGGFEVSIDWVSKQTDGSVVKGSYEKIKYLCVPAGTSVNIRDPGYSPRGYIKRDLLVSSLVQEYKKENGPLSDCNDNTTHDHSTNKVF